MAKSLKTKICTALDAGALHLTVLSDDRIVLHDDSGREVVSGIANVLKAVADWLAVRHSSEERSVSSIHITNRSMSAKQ